MENRPPNEPPSHEELLEIFYSPEIQQCLGIIDEVVGYQLSPNAKAVFVEFHNFLTNPEPKFISDWRSNDDRRYRKFIDGILGNVKNALASVEYHYERVIELEAEVMTKLAVVDYKKLLQNSAISPGNSLKLDFEYQSFVLSYRRCLDYLARSINAFFKIDSDSFNKLKKVLSNVKPTLIANKLIKIYDQHVKNFTFVLSEVTRSTRDKIAHTEFVRAGYINLNAYGFLLAGGGENILPNTTLKAILEKRKVHLEEFLKNFLEEFARAVKSLENTSS